MTTPAVPAETAGPARMLGALTVIVGVLMLVAGSGVLAYFMNIAGFFGDDVQPSGLAAALLVAFVFPPVLTGIMIAVLYIVAGRRTSSRRVRGTGLRVTGWTSWLLAVLGIWSMVSQSWEDFETPNWHIFAAAAVCVLGLHSALVGAYGRPGAPRSGAWLLVGAVTAIGGPIVIYVVRPFHVVFAAEDGTPLVMREYREDIDSLALSPDGTRLAVVTRERRITTFDPAGDSVVWSKPLTGGDLGSSPQLVLSPDGATLLYLDDLTFKQLDARTGDITRDLACGPAPADGHARTVSATFARGGTVLALAAATRTAGNVCFLDVASGTVLATNDRQCTSLTATPRGDRVWAWCGGNRITALDPGTGAVQKAIETPARLFDIFPDDNRVLIVNDHPLEGITVQVRDTTTDTNTHDFGIKLRANRIVGPFGDGARWLLDGPDGLFEIDIAGKRLQNRHCDDAQAVDIVADRIALRSATCIPGGRIEVRPPG